MDRLQQAECPDAPTGELPFGKHWWKIPMLGAHPVGCCKFCSRERQFDNSRGNGAWSDDRDKSYAIRQDQREPL